MKKHAIFAALMALVAMAAVPVMASAVTLTAPAGTKLKAGDPISAFSNNLVFTESNGVTLNCTQNNFAGEVETNGAPTSTSKITSATFTTGGLACGTNVGLTADVTAVASTLPWILHFKTADRWALTHPIFTVTFTMPPGTSVAHCTFTATEVTGTYATGGVQLALTIDTGDFTQIAPSTDCPTTIGTLAGSASAKSASNPIIAD